MSTFNNPNHGSDLPGGSSGGQSGLDATRQQVDEVVDIMRNNVEKGTGFVFSNLSSFVVLERDSKLNELDDRATSLQQGAEMFDRNAGKIQRKFWYQNMKMNFIIGGVVLVIIIIIIIVIVTSTKKDDNDNP